MCIPQASDLCFIIAGQSHGRGSGDTVLSTPAADAIYYNFYDDTFYPCADPLPGHSTGGLIWTRLGHRYSNSTVKPWGRLVLAPACVAGTTTAEWLPGATPNLLKTSIKDVHARLVQLGWNVDGIIWIQGSADANSGVSGETYIANIHTIVGHLRAQGIVAPFYMSRCAHCRLNDGPELENLSQANRITRFKSQDAILRAQDACLSETLNIVRGPNIDLIGSSNRHDNCHHTDWGQWCAAELYLDMLLGIEQEQTAFFATLNSNYANDPARTVRNVIPSSALLASGNKVRVKLVQNTGTGARAILNASIMERATGAVGLVPSTRLTFGGLNGANLSNNAPLWTDWVDFTLDATKAYLVSWDQDGTMRARSGAGQAFYHSTAQIAMQQDGTGFSKTNDMIVGVGEIQVRNQ